MPRKIFRILFSLPGIRQRVFIKIVNYFSGKHTGKRKKRQATDWEKHLQFTDLRKDLNLEYIKLYQNSALKKPIT